MTAIASAIIAVAGTLLGSVMTYFLQRSWSARAEASAFNRELRAERVAAYSSYAAALTEFRRGQLDWYNRRQEGADEGTVLAARIESYRLRGVARTALARVQIIASDPTLAAAASEALELARPVHRARDAAELHSRSDTAKVAVDRFVALGAAELQSLALGINRSTRHIADDVSPNFFPAAGADVTPKPS